MGLISLAIPGFFLLIGIEWWASRRLGRRVYRLHDTVTNLGTGIINQLVALFTAAARLALYAAVYQLRWLELEPSSAWTWLIAILGVDLGYYWFHRESHLVNLLWGVHVVHHQSEDYNYAVALRQAAFEPLFTIWFYLPLALLGVPPAVFLTANALNTIYQFLPHTRLVPKLGPLEWVMNTPSHHRVHHASDPQYLDSNFGGMFIIWDRLFGTWAEERAEPTYGTVHPLGSWNAFDANFAWFRHLAHSHPGLSLAGWVRLLAAPPGWRPGAGVAPTPLTAGRRRYEPATSGWLDLHVGLHFLIVLVLAVVLLFLGNELMAPLEQAALALFLALTLGALGGLLDGRAWARGWERARLVVLLGGALALAAGGPAWPWLLLAGLPLGWLGRRATVPPERADGP